MAVNFANLFMSNFESDMLKHYEDLHGKRPALWLRYIDDIFFIWQYDEGSLQHFISFCNDFSVLHGYKSTIKFTSHFSKETVNFLDTSVKLEPDGSLSTTLFDKPTAAHVFLHKTSYHTPHVLKSLPKSQFLRIRRICTHDVDYWSNASRYIQFFVRRGFSKSSLALLAKEVFTLKQDDLLSERVKDKVDRIPLVTDWHQKFSGISRILHENYKRVAKDHPKFQEVFTHPPMVAFRRQKNLADRLVKSKHWKDRGSKLSSAAYISANMCSDEIKNPVTGQAFKTLSYSSSVRNVVYAAKCTKCDKLYVGSTGQPLHKRFNGHRSDVQCHPDRCELPQHFAQSPACNFQNDLQIFVLEKITGDKYHRLHREEIWTQKLGAFVPNGMNKQHTDFLNIHKTLHRLP